MADVTHKQNISKKSQKEVLAQISEDLVDIESQIPSGGHRFTSYEKGKTEHIGIITNMTESLRKIPNGEFRANAVTINEKGSYTVQTAVPYTETVENSRFPCGDYNITVGNQYNLTVGAGGINITTYGNRTDGIKGRYTISTDEFNLGASGNINIRGGTNISLISRNTFNISAPNQVVVDSNLGVTKNAIINGCAFIDGETYVHHITCPAEVQYTGGGIGAFGQLMPSGGGGGGKGGGPIMIGYADVSYIKDLYNSIQAEKAPWTLPDIIPVFALPSANTSLASSKGFNTGKNPEFSIFVYPHQHPFNNIPITFTDGNGSLRTAAESLNSGNMGTAGKIEHGYKSIGKTIPGTI